MAEHTDRIAFFMSMVKAHLDLTEEDIGDDHIVFVFMGSGASDQLTYGHIRKFLEENGCKTKEQNKNEPQ